MGEYASFIGRKPELMGQASRLFSPAGVIRTAETMWSAHSFESKGFPYRVLCFSRNREWFVTETHDSAVRVWNSQTFEPVTSPLAHKGPVYDAEFSPDSRFIVTASFDKTAQIWRVDTSQPVGPGMQHTQWVYRARFDASGEKVVTASADHTARVWDARTAKPVTPSLTHNGRVHAAEFSPDGKTVLTASQDNTACVWDATTGGLRHAPLRHQNVVYTARFSANGKWIVTASADNTARIWNAGSGTPMNEPLTHGADVFSAVFSPDSRRVVTVSADGTARLWEALSGMPLSEPLPHDSSTYLAEFSPDGDWLATESRQSLSIWEVPNPSSSVPSSVLDIAEAVAGVAFNRDGQRSLVAASGLFRANKQVQQSSANDFYTRWVKWFFADREIRSVSPSNPVSTREYIRSCIQRSRSQGKEAVRLSPTNALALASLAQALTERYPDAGRNPEARAYLCRARKYSDNDPAVKAIEAEIMKTGPVEEAKDEVVPEPKKETEKK